MLVNASAEPVQPWKSAEPPMLVNASAEPVQPLKYAAAADARQRVGRAGPAD